MSHIMEHVVQRYSKIAMFRKSSQFGDVFWNCLSLSLLTHVEIKSLYALWGCRLMMVLDQLYEFIEAFQWWVLWVEQTADEFVCQWSTNTQKDRTLFVCIIDDVCCEVLLQAFSIQCPFFFLGLKGPIEPYVAMLLEILCCQCSLSVYLRRVEYPNFLVIDWT